MDHPKEEKTLVIIKPDAFLRGLLGEIVHRFERKGLKIVGMKMLHVDDVLVEEHYGKYKDKPFFDALKKYITSAPVVAIVLSGISSISATRLIVGPTAGHEADAGSIRGDFSMSVQANLVHASDSPEAAEEEIKRFFSEEEIFEFNKPDFSVIYSDSIE